MGSLNKVLLIGRLGQDPEKRITPGGHSVVNISLATTEFFKDQSGQRQDRTEWHRVVFWNRQADIVEQYCKKGSQIFVEGSLQTREWQDKDGNRRFSTDIVARNMQLLDSRPGSGQEPNQGGGGRYDDQSPGQQPDFYQQNNPSFQEPTGLGSAANTDDEFVEDDIPF